MVITKVGKLESMKSYSSTHVIYITRLNRYVFMAVTLHSKICNWWSRLESWANYSLGCSCFAKDTLFSTTSNFWRNTFRNLVPLESSLIEPIMPFIVLHRLVSHHIQRFSLRGIRQVVSALWRDLLLLFDCVTRGNHPKFIIQLWPDRRRNADPVSGTMLPALCLLSCGNSFSRQPTTQLLLFKLCMIWDPTPSLSFCLAAVNEALCMYSWMLGCGWAWSPKGAIVLSFISLWMSNWRGREDVAKGLWVIDQKTLSWSMTKRALKELFLGVFVINKQGI